MAGRQIEQVRRTGRIIERPRLTRVLDAASARVILLVGPAGYGKTTLARQWARTLSGVIWVRSTSAHRDVVTFSADVAAGIDALGGEAARFIGEYMRARTNPQRAAREIAGVLAERLDAAPVQWLVIDDYHELAGSEVEEMVSILHERVAARLLIASRLRPSWIGTRDVLYGAVAEIGADELALTPEETAQVVGRRPDLEPLIRQAHGWPAVVTLAAGLEPGATPDRTVPDTLHRYVAEELYQSAPLEVQEQLKELALLGDLSPATLAQRFGSSADAIVQHGRDLGFITHGDPRELHPLLREFLLAKVGDDPEAAARVRTAVDDALARSAWTLALDLVLRFQLDDLVDPVLQQAFKPLARDGKLGTLAAFAERVRQSPGFPPPSVDVVEAEVALGNGELELALDVAVRAQLRLPEGHVLRSRAAAIEGQAHHFRGEGEQALTAYQNARATALDAVDEEEAIFGVWTAVSWGELDAGEYVEALSARKHLAPQNLLRFSCAVLGTRRYGSGLSGNLGLAEPLNALPQVLDPRVRTSFTYTAASTLFLRGDYREASHYVELLERDVHQYGLGFALPYVASTAASVALGLRRFGDVDRQIHALEDAAASRGNYLHQLNARCIRALLLVQTGKPDEASAQLAALRSQASGIKAWDAELLATQALAEACAGHLHAVESLSHAADATTRDLSVRVTAYAARAVSAAREGNPVPTLELLELAGRTDLWHPVLCALRASEDLVALMLSAGRRDTLLQLAQRAEDAALVRRAGGRARTTRPPGEVLSPRELEVLGLMTQGRRNREIARALYVAESTVKVHVRHILEKLGVRTRAEAVARYERLRNR
jgi:ATP/maltotriose-dependent transcriptional regulator MalT